MVLKIWYFSRSYGCWQEREKRTELSQVLRGALSLGVAPTAWGRRCYSLGMSIPSRGGCNSSLREE